MCVDTSFLIISTDLGIMIWKRCLLFYFSGENCYFTISVFLPVTPLVETIHFHAIMFFLLRIPFSYPFSAFYCVVYHFCY